MIQPVKAVLTNWRNPQKRENPVKFAESLSLVCANDLGVGFSYLELNGPGRAVYYHNGNQVIQDLGEDFADMLALPDVDANTVVSVQAERVLQIVCPGSDISQINVSGCKSLQLIECNYNQLTKLDVSGLTELTTIVCDNNQIEELNVSGCSALIGIDCGYNQLAKLDTSGLTELTDIVCGDNQLTRLNISGCPALDTLGCNNNQQIISVSTDAISQDVSDAVAVLIMAADSSTGEVYLRSSDPYYSTIATAATAKGWTIKPL